MTPEEALSAALRTASAMNADNRIRRKIRQEVLTQVSEPNEIHTMEARLFREQASVLGDPRKLSGDFNQALQDLQAAILAQAETETAPSQKGSKKS